MEENKFDVYVDSIINSFQQVTQNFMGIRFQKSNAAEKLGEETIFVIVGINGLNKGRIMFAAGRDTAKTIGDKFLGEVCTDRLELYLSLGEFTNTFGGMAISMINDQYRGTKLRLTPPAVFGGEAMEIITPNIQEVAVYCKSEFGPILLNIGFGGE